MDLHRNGARSIGVVGMALAKQPRLAREHFEIFRVLVCDSSKSRSRAADVRFVNDTDELLR